MPRDLLADKALESMPQLSREPAAASPPPEEKKPNPYGTALVRVEDPFKKMMNSKIHPFSSLLNIEDLDDCDWLEHAAFDPIEAASREKVSQLHRLFSRNILHRSPIALMLHFCRILIISFFMRTSGIKGCADFHVWCHLIQLHRLCAQCALASPVTPCLQQHYQRNLVSCSRSIFYHCLALRSIEFEHTLSFVLLLCKLAL